MRNVAFIVLAACAPAAESEPAPVAGQGGVERQQAAPVESQPPASSTPASSSPAPAADSCPERYTVATRATVDMSWPETVGYFAGQSQLHAWTKATHTRAADGGTRIELTTCGVSLPVVTTTPLLDGVQLANEIPAATFELPSMPRYTGSSALQAGVRVLDTGVTVLGTSLSDLGVAWPERARLPVADHDADGKPGITALPKTGGAYGLPPADIGQTEHADAVYIASRIALRLSTAQALCEPRLEGRVEPLGFDYTIVGCHVLHGADCAPTQVNLLDNNDPAFTLGSQGQWTSVPIAETDTCADVLAALPAP